MVFPSLVQTDTCVHYIISWKKKSTNFYFTHVDNSVTSVKLVSVQRSFHFQTGSLSFSVHHADTRVAA